MHQLHLVRPVRPIRLGRAHADRPARAPAHCAAYAAGALQVSHGGLDHALRVRNGRPPAPGTLSGTSRQGPSTLACKEIA
jgi:hypothetical protein